jgi:GxxExxY protein
LPVGAKIEGLEFDEAFRLDILLDRRLVIEVKAVEKLAPIHARQTLTYLRLMKLPLGLLINFGGITLKEGIKRMANNYGQMPG